MNNKDFSMLVIAVLFLVMASGGMNMITGSSSVTAGPGDVISIPFSFEYDDGDWFGSPTSVRLVLSNIDGTDEVVYSTTASDGQICSGSFNYEVPDTEGVYYIHMVYEMWYAGGNRWVEGAGSYTVTITVELPAYEEPDNSTDGDEDSGVVSDDDEDSGVVSDDTPIDQTVDVAILGDSLWDKVAVLWELIKVFFEQLSGGK